MDKYLKFKQKTNGTLQDYRRIIQTNDFCHNFDLIGSFDPISFSISDSASKYCDRDKPNRYFKGKRFSSERVANFVHNLHY